MWKSHRWDIIQKKFRLGCKNLDDQAMPDGHKTMDSGDVLKNTEEYSEIGIWQFSVIGRLHDLGKSQCPRGASI